MSHDPQAPDRPGLLAAAAVIFDFDGVLVDSEALQYRAYSAVLERFHVRVSEEEYARHWIVEGRGPEYAVRTFHLPVSPAELRRLKHPVYHGILTEHAQLMHGALEAVQRLGTHFALGIATNSRREDVAWVLERFGLDRHFHTVVTRELYAAAKPEPDAYRTAADGLGLPPDRCVVIEDAPRGILAAHRAGARALAVPNSFTAGSDFSLAHRVLTSLDDVTPQLVSEVLAEERAHP